MKGRREVVERALSYPFAVPERSFAVAGGSELALSAVGAPGPGRVPLIAYGSNASPAVLARKLAADPDPVAVIRASLSDFDVVYSAHIAAYGSVPATLRRSPGTEAPVFVAYPTAAQLDLISETEGNYDLTAMEGISCRLEGGEVLEEATAYLSSHGCLALEESVAALAAVRSRRRSFAELSQRQALETRARPPSARPQPRGLHRRLRRGRGSPAGGPAALPLESRRWPFPRHACGACAAPRRCAASSARPICPPST